MYYSGVPRNHLSISGTSFMSPVYDEDLYYIAGSVYCPPQKT